MCWGPSGRVRVKVVCRVGGSGVGCCRSVLLSGPVVWPCHSGVVLQAWFLPCFQKKGRGPKDRSGGWVSSLRQRYWRTACYGRGVGWWLDGCFDLSLIIYLLPFGRTRSQWFLLSRNTESRCGATLALQRQVSIDQTYHPAKKVHRKSVCRGN